MPVVSLSRIDRRGRSGLSAELDQDEWLDEGVPTDAEKALIEERFRELEANPQTSIPWDEAKARLLAPFKR